VAKQNRIIASSLILYPMVYFIIICGNLVYIYFFVYNITNLIEVTIAELLFCTLYPLLNTAAYGISTSTTKLLYALCINDKGYENEEDLEKELRENNLMEPRVNQDCFTSSSSSK
jgi:hypothetical protein